MKVPLDHIRFFYTDEDLEIDQSGQATIRQRKDAFYVLPDGRFEGAKFMSCMSAMHLGKNRLFAGCRIVFIAAAWNWQRSF